MSASDLYAFADSRTRGNVAVALIAASLTITVGETLLALMQLAILQRVGHGEPLPDVERLERFESMLALPSFVVFLALATTFFVWLHRAYSNLVHLNPELPRYSPRAAVGYWFVPIINVWVPFSILRELWIGSDPQTGEFARSINHLHRTPVVLSSFWWAWLLHLFVSGTSVEGPGREVVVLNGRIAIVSSALALLAGALAIVFIREICARQERRAAILRAEVA